MSAFFECTETAVYALYGDFKFTPYYNGLFHLDAISSLACHGLRAIYNLACFTWRMLLTPFYLLNPLAWPSLPVHGVNIIDNVLGFTVSLVTIALSPVIFVLRTMASMIFGYVEGTENDEGDEAEEGDLSLAMAIR